MIVDITKDLSLKTIFLLGDKITPNVTLGEQGIYYEENTLPQPIRRNKFEFDTIIAEGQAIPVKKNIYSCIKILGFSLYGTYSGNIELRCNQKIVENVKLSLNDFQGMNIFETNSLFLKSEISIDSEKNKQEKNFYVWEDEINFLKKEIDEIVLFDNPLTMILGIEIKE